MRNVPSLKTNRGPGTAGRLAIKASIARTGHRSLNVLPRKMETPLRKGSVLLCRRITRTTDGASLLSTAISDEHNVVVGSNSFADAAVNSPALMNPKNPKQHAAHSMT